MDYPVVMLDIYGRERHPEATSGDMVVESYTDRIRRAELMLYTVKYMEGGVPPANRLILIDEEGPERTRVTSDTARASMTSGTVVTQMLGSAPQAGLIVDPSGRLIAIQGWERAEQLDEILSNIFGLEPGL